MLYTPFSASRQAQLCAKCDHVLDFDEKLCDISVLLEIFRRLNAISIAFYTPNDITRRFQRGDKSNCAQNATIYTILKKTVRYIQPVGDISTFKRYFHRILHAECYTRRFQSRDKSNCAQNATIFSILVENCALYRSCWRYFPV